MTKIKEALTSGEKKGRRLAQVALAMIGVLASHGGTLPGYHPAVYSVTETSREIVRAAFWDPVPTLIVAVLGVIAVGLVSWMNWTPDATVGLPK